MGSVLKNLPANAEDAGASWSDVYGDMDRPLGLEDILEEEMTTHSSILARKIL